MTIVDSPKWLTDTPVVERIDLDDRCWIDVVRGFVPLGDEVHDELRDQVAWEQNKVFRYERWVPEPRLGGYQRGGDRHPALAETQAWISARYHTPFDGVALAQYRHAADSVGFHRDRELRWLDNTVIAALTLGAQRPWLLKPLTGRRSSTDDDLGGAIDLSPASGDLLVMGGATQAGWLHAVPKTRHAVRSRISAQWRWTSRRGERDRNPGYYAPRHFTRR